MQLFEALDGRGSLPQRPSGSGSPLVPGLAHLQWLEELTVDHGMYPLPGGIAEEWLQPGAFPRLQE